MHKGCRFDAQAGHVQESTNERVNTLNSKSIPLSLSLKSINFKKNNQEFSLVFNLYWKDPPNSKQLVEKICKRFENYQILLRGLCHDEAGVLVSYCHFLSPFPTPLGRASVTSSYKRLLTTTTNNNNLSI